MPPLPVQYPHVCVYVCVCVVAVSFQHVLAKILKGCLNNTALRWPGWMKIAPGGGLKPLFQPPPHLPLPPPMRALKSGHFVRPVCAPKVYTKGTENGAAPHGTNVDPKCTNKWWYLCLRARGPRSIPAGYLVTLLCTYGVWSATPKPKHHLWHCAFHRAS